VASARVRVGVVDLAADEPALSGSLDGDVTWRTTPADLCEVLAQVPVDAVIFHVSVEDRDQLLESINCARSLRPSTKLLLATVSNDVVIIGEISSVLLRPGDRRGRSALTARESQVLERIQSGHTNREVAGLLGISLSTVNRHVEHILTKLSVRNRAQAVAVTLALSPHLEIDVHNGRGMAR
jgi:DNA-binding CsgD family transcriptional regulator